MDAMNSGGKESGIASVGGLRIAYESSGTGEPPLMLIHGAFQDRTYWDRQVDHLRGRRQAITLDLRGHGESDTPEEVSIQDFAADVIAVADEARLGGVVLCGHSMGGPVALAVAAARPELVRGIVMLEGVVLFPESVRRQAQENFLPALGGDRWMDALRGYFGGVILDPTDPPGLRARVMADLGRTRRQFARTFFASLFASDYADALQHARCPLLYVHAKAPADLQRLHELRPDAMVESVAGSGHYLMLSAPDQVNTLVDRFLETLAETALPG
jgi:pimeloyl-ACP methyl ester carboxylesterase